MSAAVSQLQKPSQSIPEDVWDGETYKKNATLQQRLGLQIIHSHTNQQGSKTILDVGCGDGFLTNYIAKHISCSQSVVGIDSSDSMIRTAIESKNDSKIAIKKFDITDPGITSLGLFDTIFSFNTLHWVHDQETALKNIHHLLSFGGTFRAQLFPPLASQKILIDNIAKLMREEKWLNFLKDFTLPIQMNIFTAKEYEALLLQVGFTVHNCAETIYTFTQSRDEIATGFKSWLPHLRMIPVGYHDEFLRALTDLIFEDKAARDLPTAEMSFPFWIVHASKE